MRQCRRFATFHVAFFVSNPSKRFIMFDDEEHLCSSNVSEQDDGAGRRATSVCTH